MMTKQTNTYCALVGGSVSTILSFFCAAHLFCLSDFRELTEFFFRIF